MTEPAESTRASLAAGVSYARDDAGLAALADLAGVAYVRRRDARWTLLRTSAGAPAVLGLTATEPVAGAEPGLAALIHPDDLSAVTATIDAALAEGRTFAVEYRIVAADGVTRWLMDRGRAASAPGLDDGVEGFLTDVTAPKLVGERARASAAEAEAMFAAAFRASPHSLSITELVTGRYLEVNAGFERLTGYTAAEVLGRTSLEIGVWKDVADRERLVRQLRLEGSVFGMEARFVRRDGGEVIARCSGECLRRGGVDCLVMVLEDISAQRFAEEGRRTLELKLRQAHKMEALGQLAGGIAHDFNNILTGMIAFTELAALDAGNPAAVCAHLARVRQAGDRARELVKQILTFGRRNTKIRRPIALHAVIEEAGALVRSTLPAGVTFEVRLDAAAPVVLADSTQIHQLVMNLVANAVHAVGEAGGGRVTLTLDAKACDGSRPAVVPDEVGAVARPRRFARLRVADTGVGIAPDVLRHIFEPFFTTKAVGEGTGLGLAVAHGIVEEHDGVITATSVAGEGSTFEVLLPAFVPLEEQAPLAKDADLRGAGQRVLFVDDERVLCDVVDTVLGRLGYRATTFVEPAAAVRAFRAAPDDFDIVITDLTMPGMNGIDLAHEILGLRPGLPVLLVSGFSGGWTPENVRAHGFCGLITKPLSAGDLARAIRTVLAPGSRSPFFTS